MERDEFKSLPPDFFDEQRPVPDPRWLLALGTACALASLVIALVLLLGP